MHGYFVVRTRDGEMPEYFYSRNYKWLSEPNEKCVYKEKWRAEKALDRCKKRYGDNRTRFSIVGTDETIALACDS